MEQASKDQIEEIKKTALEAINDTFEKGELSEDEKTLLINKLTQNILEEEGITQRPDINEWQLAKERFLMKGLEAPAEDAATYLNTNYPFINAEATPDNEVTIRDPQTGERRQIDPRELEFQDVSDIAGDVAKGAIETGAGAAGGLMGLLSPIPGSSMAGAMGASALAGAGTEAAQQALAKKIGLRKEYDPERMKMSAAISGAFPMISGTGATKEMVARSLSKKLPDLAKPEFINLLETLTKRGMEKQKGLVGRGYDKMMPFIMEKLGGPTRETTRYIARNLPKVAQFVGDFRKNSNELARNLSSNMKLKLQEVNQNMRDKYEAMFKKYDELGVLVDVSNLAKQVSDELDKLHTQLKEGTGPSAKVIRARIKAIEKMSDSLFSLEIDVPEKQVSREFDWGIGAYNTVENIIMVNKKIPVGPTLITPSQAHHMKQVLKSYSKIGREVQGHARLRLEGTKELSDKLFTTLNNDMKNLHPDFKNLSDEYLRKLELVDNIEGYFEDPNKTKATLQKYLDPSDDKINTLKGDLDEVLTPNELADLEDKANLFHASKDLYGRTIKKGSPTISLPGILTKTIEPVLKTGSKLNYGLTTAREATPNLLIQTLLRGMSEQNQKYTPIKKEEK
jgi:hypothetical protein